MRWEQRQLLPPFLQNNKASRASQERRREPPFILTLDLPRNSRLVRYTVSKVDGQLCMDPAPIHPPAGPFFRTVHHCQMQHFEEAVVRRKDGFCLCHLAKLTFETLYGIGRIDEPTYFLRILEVGAQVRPVIPPGLGDFRIFGCIRR